MGAGSHGGRNAATALAGRRPETYLREPGVTAGISKAFLGVFAEASPAVGLIPAKEHDTVAVHDTAAVAAEFLVQSFSGAQKLLETLWDKLDFDQLDELTRAARMSSSRRWPARRRTSWPGRLTDNEEASAHG